MPEKSTSNNKLPTSARPLVLLQPGPTGAEVSASSPSPSPPEVSGAAEVVRPPASGPWDYSLLSAIGSSVNRVPSLLPNSEDELPPLLITTGENGEGGGWFSHQLFLVHWKSASSAPKKKCFFCDV